MTDDARYNPRVQTKPWAGKLRGVGTNQALSGFPVAAGYRHREDPPEGIDLGYRGSRCRCLGPRPRQQCWLDFTAPDGVCDACRTVCRPAWRLP